jgi:RNA polymerase sigma-70 factor (ECF subfamily)
MPVRRSHVPLSLVVGQGPRAANDGELARALATRDPWAVAETWRRFAPMVLKMAERTLGSRSEADDIAQEVFHHVFRKANALRDPDSLRSFVYSFAVRELKSELRRRRLRGWLCFQEPQTLVDVGGPTLDVESRDLLRRCHALLGRLRPRDRLVFVLRRMEAMTVEEIAASMSLSISTVKRSMNHASDRLSRWIEADPGLAGLLQDGRWER